MSTRYVIEVARDGAWTATYVSPTLERGAQLIANGAGTDQDDGERLARLAVKKHKAEREAERERVRDSRRIEIEA